MTIEVIRGKIIKAIVSQLSVKVNEITDESKFIEDLGADSLDTVELIMSFEEEFDIEIHDEEAEKLTTVGKAIDFLKSKLC